MTEEQERAAVSSEYVMSKFANSTDLREAMIAEIARLRASLAKPQPTEMKAAFEEKYQRDSEDPTCAEELRLFGDGWNAKPQPVGGALTDAVIVNISRRFFGEYETDANVVEFAREILATLSAPAAQPGEAVPEADMLKVIDERDRLHEVADDLAAQIAAITGEELGEHSSANDPWRNAMLAADEFIAKQIRKLLTGPAKSEVEMHAAKCPALDGAPCVCGAAPAQAAAVSGEQIIKLAEEHFRSYAHEAKTVFLEFAEDLLQLATRPAQPSESAPTDEAIKAAITNSTGFEWEQGELQPMNAHDLFNIARAVLGVPKPASQAAAVSEGWKLVPIEPTKEMAKAGNAKTWVLPSSDCYKAMLAAAPKAQAAAVPAPPKPLNLMRAMEIATEGFVTYADAHPKWFKRIDHTPIPNDLGVHMAQAFVNALAAPEAGAGGGK